MSHLEKLQNEVCCEAPHSGELEEGDKPQRGAMEDKGGKERFSRNSEKSLLAMSSLLCLKLNHFRIQK